jgi:hypothetical protein
LRGHFFIHYLMAFRQARQLAEGQKGADVKHELTAHPPSASQENWRSGSYFPRNMQVSDLFAHHLAERVEYLEKYADFGSLKPSFGG